MKVDSNSILGLASAQIGLFEAVCWGINPKPFSSHDEMSLVSKSIQVGVNALPHAAFGAIILRRGNISAESLCLYAPYASFFASMVAYNWVLPWLGFETVMSSKLREKLEKSSCLLGYPRLKSSILRPSLEHSLLFPVAATAAALALSKAHGVARLIKKPWAQYACIGLQSLQIFGSGALFYRSLQSKNTSQIATGALLFAFQAYTIYILWK